MRQKTSTNDSTFGCVLFGYKLSDEDVVGYFGKNLDIVEDVKDAKFFSLKKTKRQRGFGTPRQWLDFINEDSDLNHGFRFHLVKMNIEQVTKI